MLHQSGRARSIRARCTVMYYELNKTRARWAFKQLLGQANHFLITVLVGLDGVRSGKIELGEEFQTSWNPRDVARSADRSRVFVLDLALVRAVDALDTYMMHSARKPLALPNADFIAAMDGTGRSVAKRLAVFDAHLESVDSRTKSAIDIAIEWRNQRVHSLAKDTIDKRTKDALLSHEKYFSTGYSGLDIKELLSRFDSGEAPTFKEAAAVVRLCHEAVEHYDKYLLEQLNVETYLKASLVRFFGENGGAEAVAIRKTWGHPTKKQEKVKRLLRLVGVNCTPVLNGREVSSGFVDKLIALNPDSVGDFLRD